MQMFSCEYCKNIKNSFSYRTPPVAAFVSSLNTYQISTSNPEVGWNIFEIVNYWKSFYCRRGQNKQSPISHLNIH